jgi:hypothetical protein
MSVSLIAVKELFGAGGDLLRMRCCHGHAKPFPDEPVLKGGTKQSDFGIILI